MSSTHEAIKAMYDAFSDYLLDRAVAEGDLIEEDDTQVHTEEDDAPAPTEEENELPPLLEDEIAEILNEHKGEKIQIYFQPQGPLNCRYYSYEKDNGIVFAIYDALENHHLVTVSGTNILDL